MHIEEQLQLLQQSRSTGRYEEALQSLLQLTALLDDQQTDTNRLIFFTMLEWQLLTEVYAPAKQALCEVRNRHKQKLIEGDNSVGTTGARSHLTRFSLIADMNRLLNEPDSTYRLYMQLRQLQPAIASQETTLALPTIVAAQNFELAEQHLPELKYSLTDINQLSRKLALLPPHGTAPRLAAELMVLAGNLKLHIDVLNGLGRQDEAQTIRTQTLQAIDSEALRSLAEQEIRVPGSILEMLTEYEMQHEQDR